MAAERPGAAPRPGWRGYLDRFHAERAGVTEAVFSHLDEGPDCVATWIRETLLAPGDVLDVACGSAPLSRGWPGRWVGVDRSVSELGVARRRDAHPLILGDATALPLRGAPFDTVICSMALMLLQPLGLAVSEMARVLRPGGRLVVLVPDTRPLTARDLVRYVRILAATRRPRLEYPNDLARLPDALHAGGFELVDDARRRFACLIDSPGIARLFVESLYLPGVDADRVSRAVDVAARWAGSAIGIPLRRIVAVRRP